MRAVRPCNQKNLMYNTPIEFFTPYIIYYICYEFVSFLKFRKKISPDSGKSKDKPQDIVCFPSHICPISNKLWMKFYL
jgi:hypothetical protein